MALLDLQGMDNRLDHHGHPSSHSAHSCSPHSSYSVVMCMSGLSVKMCF